MDLLQLAILGLGAGTAYVLIGQGIVLIYRGSGTLNFAQGAIAMMAAQSFFSMRDAEWPTPLAFTLALGLSGLIGLAMQALVLRPLRNSAALVRLVATLGLLTLCLGVATLWWGGHSQAVRGVLPSRATHLTDSLIVPIDRLYLFGICTALTLLLSQIYQRTRFGLATAGAAENERAAISLGWSPSLLGGVNWVVGSVLAGLAGIFLAPVIGLSVRVLTLTVVAGMAAALVGRFSSFWLTLVGGLAIGIAQSYVVRYVSEPGWSNAVPFLLITALVVVRGQALPLRGELLERPVRVGRGRVPWQLVTALVAGALAVIWSLSHDWLLAATTTLGLAVISLSFVVVTGYAGQISLAQLTIAGVGAWVAGVASHYWDFPMAAAIATAVAASVGLGLLTGLPALRCRGMNLAVVTLGMSVVIEGVILANHRWQGGLNGLTVGEPVLFGINVSYVTHPERFASLLLLAFVAAALLVTNIRRSQSGRKLLAVRSNERAAASLGINVTGAKLFAFALGAGLAGLGGAIMTFQFPVASLLGYTTLGSITLLVNAVVGGMGFVFGGLQGGLAGPSGLVHHALSKLGGDSSDLLTVIVGGLVLVVILVHPDGFASRVSDVLDHLLRRSRRSRAATPALSASDEPTPSRSAEGEHLEVSSVTVTYGGVVAVDDVSFSAAPGEVVGIIGPNGAGKTTLVDALCGFTPSSGEVRMGAASLNRLSAAQRARVGLARTFQSVELFDDMSVLENIQVGTDCGQGLPLGLSYLRDLVRPRRRPLPPAAAAAIDDLELAEYLDHRPGELPAGRQRLAGIARALSTNPSVVCLDEPAAGLSSVEAQELAALIRQIAERWQLSVIVIEHNVDFVRTVSDRVLALDLGRVIADGPPSEVLTDPAVIAAYIGGDPDGGEAVDALPPDNGRAAMATLRDGS